MAHYILITTSKSDGSDREIFETSFHWLRRDQLPEVLEVSRKQRESYFLINPDAIKVKFTLRSELFRTRAGVLAIDCF